MHSTIASFSAGVPVIPFSYSRKFEGLYDNLNYPFVVHGRTDSTEQAVRKTLDWIENKEQLKKKIKEQLITVQEYQTIFEEDLRKLIIRRRN